MYECQVLDIMIKDCKILQNESPGGATSEAKRTSAAAWCPAALTQAQRRGQTDTVQSHYLPSMRSKFFAWEIHIRIP